MATVVIQKRKKKSGGFSYLVTYWDPLDESKKHYKSFPRYKEARLAANDLRTLIDTGKLSKIEKRKNKVKLMTFSEVSDSLRAEWEERVKNDDLKQKTFDEYSCWLNVLRRTFGDYLLCEVTEDHILSYRNQVAVERSNVTSNRGLFVVKQVFKHGLQIQSVLDNPSKEIKYLSERGQERNAFLLPPQLDKLIEASRQVKAKYMKAMICLGAEHGASKQEVLSLQWGDVDFEYDGQGIIRFFRTKNGKERTQYLMPRTREALLGWKHHQKRERLRQKIEVVKSDLVFCRHDGTPIRRFDKAWGRVREIAGFNRFHFHDLRHTYCSNLILSGADLKDVKEMIGHSDLSMTDRYSHLTLGHKRLQQNRLAEHYSTSKN